MPVVKVDDINIFYRVFSKGVEKNTLDLTTTIMIVCHGGMGIIDHQLEVAPFMPLSNNVQLVFIDTRGCGRTDDGDQKRWTMDQFGDDIFNFSQTLGIKHPIVAGISSGGYASISYAIRHPEHPRALILLNTEPVVSPDAKREAYAALAKRSDKREFLSFQKLTDNEIDQYASAAAAAVYAYDFLPTLENFEKFVKYGFSIISKTAFEIVPPFRQNMEMKKLFANGYQKFDYSEDMSKIMCPVLWLAGEWDPLHPACCAKKGAEKLSNVYLKILSAGAPVYQDDPHGFYREVRTFLSHN